MSEFTRAQDNVSEFFRQYADSIRDMVKDPSAFFVHQSEKSGYLEPTVFALINILIFKLFYALLMAPFTLGLSLFLLIPSVMYQLCLLGLTSVILFGMIRFFNGRSDFEGVYRSVAYASTASLLLLLPVPFFNLLLSAAGLAYFLYFALRDAHGLNQQQAIITLITPLVFMMLLGMVSTLLALFFLINSIIYVIGFF